MNPLKVRRLTDITPAEHSARRFIHAELNQERTQTELCKVCPKPVWFTAFFDGTGNNYNKDGDGVLDATDLLVKYSNIAKLGMLAHPQDKVPGDNSKPDRVHSFYIQGVGTPCEVGLVKDSGKGYDNALGMAAARKGQDRISEMLVRFEAAVNKHWPLVSQINLAVFGFSRGATQARAFVRQLNDKLASQQGDKLFWNKTNANQKKPEVVVYFVGLMDTVSSTGYGGSRGESMAKVAVPSVSGLVVGPLLGTLVGAAAGGVLVAVDDGGHAEWSRNLAIPSYVQQCVHYVAAHEVREKFPSDSVRRDREVPPNCVEYVYPGMHSDVGGGYAPCDPSSQEGRGNELARIPLCHMFIAAYKAGVPFNTPAEVLASAGGLFEISPELERAYDVYMDNAPAHGRLEDSIAWHMNRYYDWRESRRRRLADGRLKPAKSDPYMDITDVEWADDVLGIARSQTGYFKSSAGVKEHAIYSAYRGNNLSCMAPEIRKSFDLFFDRYVHDSIAGFKKQMKDAFALLKHTECSRWSVNRKVFMGKRGDKFLYWTYQSAGSGVADIQMEGDSLRDESPAAKRQRASEAADARQRAQWKAESDEYRRMHGS